MIVDLPNRRATRQLAFQLASVVRGGDLVILSGSLGAGKTFFVRALCRAVGLPVTERVTSPTFTLVREVETQPPIAHADLYRVESNKDVRNLGLDAQREDGWLLLVEWGAPYETALGGDAVHIDISLSPRRALLSSTGGRSAQILSALTKRRAPLTQDSTPAPAQSSARVSSGEGDGG